MCHMGTPKGYEISLRYAFMCAYFREPCWILYSQGNMKIRCNSYQNSNNISHRNRNSNHKIYMDPQKTTNSQSTFDKEQQRGIYPTSWCQTILQNCPQALPAYGFCGDGINADSPHKPPADKFQTKYSGDPICLHAGLVFFCEILSLLIFFPTPRNT